MAGPCPGSDTRAGTIIGAVIEGVDELANAVTSVLSPDGPLASLTGTLTNALDSVWADFFGATTPPGGTNWNAYSHQQLYDMLWRNADVADVSSVAAEWRRHSAALTGFADALRGQAAALRSNWQGRAADSAADRLAELSDRIWNVGARAGAVGKAVDSAGDALALARNTMPPPPPDPLTLMTSAVGAGPLPPLDAVMIGAARLFTGDATAGAAKAEAVRVMQRYEASLHHSGNQVVPARADATKSTTFQVDGQTGAATPGVTTSVSAFTGGGSSVGRGVAGVPWARLVGGAAPGPGGVSGIGPGPVPGVLAAEEAVAAENAMGGGMYPPFLRRANGAEDEEHRNTLPNVNDNRFFMPDQRATVPVIGADTDKERDGGR